MNISAVIPTRGDVDLSEIIFEITRNPEIEEVVVERSDTPYGWYVGAMRARNDIIYYQDDDCITDTGAVIAAYQSGVIVNAITPQHAAQYPGRQTLLGFGSIFDKSLLAILDGWERDEVFMRESVRVFSSIVPHKSIFPRIEILPCAMDQHRLYRQPDHAKMRKEIERRIGDFKRTGNR